jgi:hypothetical protein
MLEAVRTVRAALAKFYDLLNDEQKARFNALPSGEGRGIVALVQKAADLAKADCNRAMDLAHRLSSELRAAEERAREFEAQANYFRDRAAHAEVMAGPHSP